MKKLFLFLAVTSTALFTSCSSDDDSATTPPVVEEGVTAIDVTSNVSSVTLGGSFIFTVKDQAGNVLPTAVLTINDTAIANPFTPTAVGTHTITATFENFTDTVTVTITAVPQTENTFSINGGTEYTTDLSLFVYLGTDESNINTWVAAAAKTDETGEEVINQTAIYFTNTQVDEQYLDFPTAGNFSFGGAAQATVDAEILYNTSEEIVTTDLIQSLNLNIISIAIPAAEGEPQNWSYAYDLTLTDGTALKGNFNGDWEFINAAGRPGRNTNTAKQVVRLSSAQIKQNLANFLKK